MRELRRSWCRARRQTIFFVALQCMLLVPVEGGFQAQNLNCEHWTRVESLQMNGNIKGPAQMSTMGRERATSVLLIKSMQLLCAFIQRYGSDSDSV